MASRTEEGVSLSEFMVGRRTGNCTYCTTVPQEYKDQINAQVASGVKAWAAFAEWLNTKDIKVTRSMVMAHFAANHE